MGILLKQDCQTIVKVPGYERQWSRLSGWLVSVLTMANTDHRFVYNSDGRKLFEMITWFYW